MKENIIFNVYDIELIDLDFNLQNLFPPLWDGTLALKNDHAFVRMHYVRGSEHLARMALPAFADMSQNVLKITQRMRLEPTQLENVTRNLKVINHSWQ